MTRARDESGFTLIELLIAMTLLALLMAMVLGGFRLGTRAWEVGDRRLDQLSRLQSSHDFLRRQIAQAYPADISDEDADFTEIRFDGGLNRLTFVTLLPIYLAPGGFYELSVRTREGDEGRDLVVDWALFVPDQDGFEIEPQEPSVLLEDIDSIEFSYFGREDASDREATWNSSWSEFERLPELVRLEVFFPDGDDRQWPELIVAPTLAVQPEAS